MNIKKKTTGDPKSQTKSGPSDKKDTLLSVIETAMAEELKASNFYREISNQLEDKAAKFKFEVMADAEQRHYDLLKNWCKDKFGKTPKTKKIDEARIVKIKKPKKTATYEDTIKIIINAEERACKFYEDAAKKAKDIDAKKLFEKLSEIERKHVVQFEDEFRVVTEPSLRCAEEEIPWMMEV